MNGGRILNFIKLQHNKVNILPLFSEIEKNNIVLICIHTKELSITFSLNICKEDHEKFIATQVYVNHFVLFASHFYSLGSE